MSAALAPFFRGVKHWQLFLAAHVISASSFIVPYMQFQKEAETLPKDSPNRNPANSYGNLAFFLGVGVSSFLVWVSGTAGGFLAAFGFPPGFEEALKFILPGYFAGLLVVEMKGRTMPLVCLGSLIAAVPGALVNPGWGWLVTAILVATLGWGLEEWKLRASR
jgi:predicted branched-subunit amino acid permease